MKIDDEDSTHGSATSDRGEGVPEDESSESADSGDA